jgi:hypothetical protein
MAASVLPGSTAGRSLVKGSGIAVVVDQRMNGTVRSRIPFRLGKIWAVDHQSEGRAKSVVWMISGH